jgi:hypothetical protein
LIESMDIIFGQVFFTETASGSVAVISLWEEA